MKSIEDCAKVIAENANLNLQERENVLLDKKNKIMILFRNNKWHKGIRFLHKDGKEYNPFLYIQEDEIQKTISLTFVIRDNEKQNVEDIVRIISFNGHDIVVYNNNEREYNLFINSNFFFNDGNVEIRDKNNNQIKVPAGEFNVEDIVDDICKAIVNAEHNTEKWDEEINSILKFVRPGISMLVSDTKEKLNWLIEAGLIIPTGTIKK